MGGKVYTLAFVKCAKHRYCLHSVITLQQRQAEEAQRFTWSKKGQIFFFFKLSKELSGFNCLNSIAEEYFGEEKSFLLSCTGRQGKRASTCTVYDTGCSHQDQDSW